MHLSTRIRAIADAFDVWVTKNAENLTGQLHPEKGKVVIGLAYSEACPDDGEHFANQRALGILREELESGARLRGAREFTLRLDYDGTVPRAVTLATDNVGMLHLAFQEAVVRAVNRAMTIDPPSSRSGSSHIR